MVVVRASRQVLSEGLCEAQSVASLPVAHCGGGGVMSPAPGGELSVVHRENVLLLTQRGNTSFDFCNPYGGIVLSGVTWSRAAFIGRGRSGIRACRFCIKALVNTLGWPSWISIPNKNGLWLSSWRKIVLLSNGRQSTWMSRVDTQAKLWTALCLLRHVFVISK